MALSQYSLLFTTGSFNSSIASALHLSALGRSQRLYTTGLAAKPIYHLYAWMFSCNLEEMENENLHDYKNLASFFYRSLKPTARVIEDAPVVSSV